MTKPFDPPLQPHEVQKALPQYFNISPYAEGGQGCVFTAVSPGGMPVALKVYSPDQLLMRAEMEVQKLQRLTSPYVVRLVDFGPLDVRGKPSFFSATKFEQGEDLRRTLQRDTLLAESEVRKLLTHMSRAIDALWQVRVVHCDIKPANILRGADGCYRLIDLGLAKHLDTETITQTGLVMGTVGYMAPEQLKGRKNFTLRVDLFALGIVAYQALTGLHPFNGNQWLIATGQVKPIRPSTFVRVTPETESTILQLLQPNPLYRPASGTEVLQRLGG